MARSMFAAVQSLCFIFACLLSACVSPGTSGNQYREPKVEAVVNEAVVKLPFSDTWDLLMGQLSKSFFVINNVEKLSRIINLSFSTDKPEEYADCGASERTFQYENESKTYTYPVAGASTYKVAGHYKLGFYTAPLIDYISKPQAFA